MAAITKRTLWVMVALILAGSVSAFAQVRHERIVVVPRARFAAPLFYDPFWSPYYVPWVYPYVGGRSGTVKVEVTPKQTEVWVDGYYAGLVSDVGRLRTTPGGHAVTLYLEGFRTVTENVYVRPDSTFKLHETMVKLGPGEVSAAPPLPGAPHGIVNKD